MKVAIIDEHACVGCSRCVPACPVDAIVGAHKFIHNILPHECIGCGLCVAPCPMDCITMLPQPVSETEKSQKATIAKQRYIAKQQRLQRNHQRLIPPPIPAENRKKHIQDNIKEALNRVASKQKTWQPYD